MVMIVISSYMSMVVDYKSDANNLDSLMFYCVFLPLTSQEETRCKLIFLHVWNIISYEFFLY